MTWRVARSLDTALDEVNDLAPDRSTVSDGSIGDAAHASRDSDHNPWVEVDGVGVVRARDFTHDPAGGLDCNDLAERCVALYRERHPAFGPGAYTIWNRRIISRDRLAEGWRPYTGSNPHDHHLHQSVAIAAVGFDSTRPWGIADALDPDQLPDAADLERIARAALGAQVDRVAGGTTRRVLATDLTPHQPDDGPTVWAALLRAGR